jgi:RNA polymerase sigma-70 factor (ECF subfamily)
MDRSRIETLIARNYSGLRLLLKRRSGDPEVAADLLNSAITKAWENWQAGKLARPEQIAGYVYQVAMNLLRNHRRSTFSRPDKRASQADLELIAAPGSESTEDDWAAERIAAEVRRLVESLPIARDRTIVRRFYLDEEEKQAICRDMEIDALQFDKIIFRARARLKELLRLRGLVRTDFFVLCLA